MAIVLSLNSWFPLQLKVNFFIVNKNTMPDIKLLFAGNRNKTPIRHKTPIRFGSAVE